MPASGLTYTFRVFDVGKFDGVLEGHNIPDTDVTMNPSSLVHRLQNYVPKSISIDMSGTCGTRLTSTNYPENEEDAAEISLLRQRLTSFLEDNPVVFLWTIHNRTEVAAVDEVGFGTMGSFGRALLKTLLE